MSAQHSNPHSSEESGLPTPGYGTLGKVRLRLTLGFLLLRVVLWAAVRFESIWLKPLGPQYREETGVLGWKYKNPGVTGLSVTPLRVRPLP